MYVVFFLPIFDSDLMEKIQNSRTQLIITAKNNNDLHDGLKHSDSLFNETCKNYIDQIPIHDDRQSSKVN